MHRHRHLFIAECFDRRCHPSPSSASIKWAPQAALPGAAPSSHSGIPNAQRNGHHDAPLQNNTYRAISQDIFASTLRHLLT